MHSYRLTVCDHYLCSPIRGLDVTYSEFRGSDVKQVPVIRIFGSSLEGKKSCLHVHGVFPYIYVPYEGSEPPDKLKYLLAAGLDKAINVSFGQTNSLNQHVYKINLVSGIPFYGYHEKEHQFFKIFLYNPNLVKRATELLQNGTVLNTVHQPHEAHVPFILQFMIDYNLQGMNLVNCAYASPRRPTEGELPDDVAEDAPLKVSTCEVEVDVLAVDIENRRECLSQTVVNPGLAMLWEDEHQRRRAQGRESQFTPQVSQSRDQKPCPSEDFYRQRLLLRLQELSQDESLSTQSTEGSAPYPAEAPDGDSLLNASVVELHTPRRNLNADNSTIVTMDQSGPSTSHNFSMLMDSQDKELLDVLCDLAGSQEFEDPLEQQLHSMQDAEDEDCVLGSQELPELNCSHYLPSSAKDVEEEEDLEMTQPFIPSLEHPSQLADLKVKHPISPDTDDDKKIIDSSQTEDKLMPSKLNTILRQFSLEKDDEEIVIDSSQDSSDVRCSDGMKFKTTKDSLSQVDLIKARKFKVHRMNLPESRFSHVKDSLSHLDEIQESSQRSDPGEGCSGMQESVQIQYSDESDPGEGCSELNERLPSISDSDEETTKNVNCSQISLGSFKDIVLNDEEWDDWKLPQVDGADDRLIPRKGRRLGARGPVIPSKVIPSSSSQSSDTTPVTESNDSAPTPEINNQLGLPEDLNESIQSEGNSDIALALDFVQSQNLEQVNEPERSEDFLVNKAKIIEYLQSGKTVNIAQAGPSNSNVKGTSKLVSSKKEHQTVPSKGVVSNSQEAGPSNAPNFEPLPLSDVLVSGLCDVLNTSGVSETGESECHLSELELQEGNVALQLLEEELTSKNQQATTTKVQAPPRKSKKRSNNLSLSLSRRRNRYNKNENAYRQESNTNPPKKCSRDTANETNSSRRSLSPPVLTPNISQPSTLPSSFSPPEISVSIKSPNTSARKVLKMVPDRNQRTIKKCQAMLETDFHRTTQKLQRQKLNLQMDIPMNKRSVITLDINPNSGSSKKMKLEFVVEDLKPAQKHYSTRSSRPDKENPQLKPCSIRLERLSPAVIEKHSRPRVHLVGRPRKTPTPPQEKKKRQRRTSTSARPNESFSSNASSDYMATINPDPRRCVMVLRKRSRRIKPAIIEAIINDSDSSDHDSQATQMTHSPTNSQPLPGSQQSGSSQGSHHAPQRNRRLSQEIDETSDHEGDGTVPENVASNQPSARSSSLAGKGSKERRGSTDSNPSSDASVSILSYRHRSPSKSPRKSPVKTPHKENPSIGPLNIIITKSPKRVNKLSLSVKSPSTQTGQVARKALDQSIKQLERVLEDVDQNVDTERLSQEALQNNTVPLQEAVQNNTVSLQDAISTLQEGSEDSSRSTIGAVLSSPVMEESHSKSPEIVDELLENSREDSDSANETLNEESLRSSIESKKQRDTRRRLDYESPEERNDSGDFVEDSEEEIDFNRASTSTMNQKKNKSRTAEVILISSSTSNSSSDVMICTTSTTNQKKRKHASSSDIINISSDNSSDVTFPMRRTSSESRLNFKELNPSELSQRSKRRKLAELKQILLSQPVNSSGETWEESRESLTPSPPKDHIERICQSKNEVGHPRKGPDKRSSLLPILEETREEMITSFYEYNSENSLRDTTISNESSVYEPLFNPPSRQEVIKSLTEHNLQEIKFQEPFYGNPTDVRKQKEVGGRVIKLISHSTCDLPHFDSIFSVPKPTCKEALTDTIVIEPLHLPPTYEEVLGSMRVPEQKVIAETQYEGKLRIQVPDSPGREDSDQDSMTLSPCSEADRPWTPLSPMPSQTKGPVLSSTPMIPKVLARCLTPSVRRSSTQSDSWCKLDGPSPLNNTFGFRVANDNLKEARALVQPQQLTVLALELHVSTRGDLRPDPDTDSIGSVFFLASSDDGCGVSELGMITLDTPGLTPSMLQSPGRRHAAVILVPSEKELVLEVVRLVRHWDPDILLGYEIEMESWGYLIQRASHLELNLINLLSRVPKRDKENQLPQHQKQQAPGSQGALLTTEFSDLRITGRIILNLWRLMRHEVALQSYVFENVVFHILHERVPHYSFRALTHWWDHPSKLYRWIVSDYWCSRVQGCARLVERLDLLGRTAELAKLFGIQFYEVLSRGSQFRVESMMLRLAKPRNFVPVSPSIYQRAHMRAPECLPLILEPESRYYADPVIVLDFQSLYPSVIIAYNYCFSTCLGRVEHLGQDGAFEFGCTKLRVPKKLIRRLSSNCYLSPCGVAFVKREKREGVLPRMLREILDTRLMVKKSMKENKEDATLQRVLHARQLGLKLIANVTYGYTAANFSGRMPCSEVADSVVSKGRETLDRAIQMVKERPDWGARVIYGDTDSMFVLVPGKTRAQAFAVGEQIASAVTADNPTPIKLKLEKVYQPCILQTKKRYVGFMYESAEQATPVYEAKGIETVRRDGCPAVSKMLEKSLRVLFETQDVSLVKQYVTKQFQKILMGRINLQDLVFAKEFRGFSGYKPGACVPALELSRQWIRVDRRAEPRHGERVPYVVVSGAPGLPLIKLVRSPHDLLHDPGLRINAEYYITRAITPALERCFSLIGADVHQWYSEMPRRTTSSLPTVNMPGNRTNARTISQYFATVECAACRKEQTREGLCGSCQAKPRESAIMLVHKVRRWERASANMNKLCANCCGHVNGVECTSLVCPILFRRVQSDRDKLQVPYVRQLLSKYFSF